jgi:hypothetical protein
VEEEVEEEGPGWLAAVLGERGVGAPFSHNLGYKSRVRGVVGYCWRSSKRPGGLGPTRARPAKLYFCRRW